MKKLLYGILLLTLVIVSGLGGAVITANYVGILSTDGNASMVMLLFLLLVVVCATIYLLRNTDILYDDDF